MAKGLHTELLGVGAGKALGWTQPQMLAVAAAKAKAGFSLDERALGRVAKGRASPQSRTRLLILPISAKVLGLSCESIAREIYWRDTYERLSEEISEGGTPIALEGFLLHLLEINEADDAGSAWNHAMAPYMFADLQWDAMKSDAFAGVLGHSKREIRQSCVVQFKLARDRFSAFAARVRSGAFGLEAEPANLMAARADSLRAVAAEQLFSLALLNQQHDWKLTIDENGPPLSVRQTVELLPAADEVSRFSSILVGFLPGRGWRRRIDNNKAVLSLAIASAVVETGRVEATSISRLKATCNEAVAALRAPCDGERVALHELPTYQSLARAELIETGAAPTSAGNRSTSRLAVAILAGLFFAGFQPTLKPSVDPVSAIVSQSQLRSPVHPSVLWLAGPGGTRPTVAEAVGPGGTVATTLIDDNDVNKDSRAVTLRTDLADHRPPRGVA